MRGVRRDLYWEWAEATSFAYTGAGEHDDVWWVQLLLELTADPEAALKLHDHLRAPVKGFVPFAYRKRNVRFCTAWVEKAYISQLPDGLVVRFKLGVAARSNRLVDLFDLEAESSPMAEDPDVVSLVTVALDSQQGQSSVPCRLAVIDDYINLEHPTFGDASGRSRVVLSWDQSGNRTSGTPSAKFGYQQLLGNTRRWADSQNKRAASHGTHVASLAGGRETPPSRMRYTSPADFATTAARDEASLVPLAMVMLPDLTVSDTSGGALGVNVLDALRFLCDHTDPSTHLVVNLSFGTMAGPHDGSSPLEAAISDLIDKRGGKLTVVLPAGNSFESQCHAAFPLAPGASHALTWRILPDDRTCSFLELWLPSGAQGCVEIKPPGNLPPRSLSLDQSVEWKTGPYVFAGAWYASSPANGDGKQMVLIAVAPTKAHEAQTAPHGDWTVTLTNKGGELSRVHAWIERDNASFGRRVIGRQSYLVDDSSARFIDPMLRSSARDSGVMGLGSLNGIGCASNVTVVGGFEFRSGKTAKYSSAGHPPDVRCPDGMAACEESRILQGLPGAGNTNLGVVRIRGTSVAAPVVTRWFVNEVLSNRRVPWPPTTGGPTPPDPQRGSAIYRWGR